MKVLVATSSTADDRKTLAAVRSLGRSGAWVEVAGDRHASPPFYSRYCRGRKTYPDPSQGMDACFQSLLTLAEHGQYDVILPLCDYMTRILSLNEEALRRFAAFVVPAPESLALAHDKFEVRTVAHRVGIATPKTICPGDGEFDALAETLDYPCVLKLRKGAGAVGMGFAQAPADLLRLYKSLPDQSDLIYDRKRPIIQEVVPGDVHDVCLMFNRGAPRAALTQRRLIMHPPEGGPGICVETTDEPDLRDAAIALLEALDWHGPAQVEFKRDTRDDTPKLIDINARFWGTLDTSIQAGVNFPLIACRIALEGDVQPIQSYRVGLRYRWPFPHGWRHARQQEHRWRSLWQFLKPRRNTCSDLWLSDPRPHLAEACFYRRRARGAA